MKRSLVLCAAIVLCANAAYATDFYWDCSTTSNWPNHFQGGLFDCGTNYNPDATPTLPGAADRVIIDAVGGSGTTWRMEKVNGGPNVYSVTYGEFVTNVNAVWGICYGTYTINTVDDCGPSGDLIYRGLGMDGTRYNGNLTLNVDGNYLITGGGANHRNADTINLYGTGKAFRDTSSNWTSVANKLTIFGSVYDNGSTRGYTCQNTVTVMPGARIITNPNLVRGIAGTQVGGAWWARRFTFSDGQASLPNLKDNVTFGYQPAVGDNGPAGSNRLVVTGGVIYPQDLRIGTVYWGTAA